MSKLKYMYNKSQINYFKNKIKYDKTKLDAENNMFNKTSNSLLSNLCCNIPDDSCNNLIENNVSFMKKSFYINRNKVFDNKNNHTVKLRKDILNNQLQVKQVEDLIIKYSNLIKNSIYIEKLKENKEMCLKLVNNLTNCTVNKNFKTLKKLNFDKSKIILSSKSNLEIKMNNWSNKLINMENELSNIYKNHKIKNLDASLETFKDLEPFVLFYFDIINYNNKANKLNNNDNNNNKTFLDKEDSVIINKYCNILLINNLLIKDYYFMLNKKKEELAYIELRKILQENNKKLIEDFNTLLLEEKKLYNWGFIKELLILLDLII